MNISLEEIVWYISLWCTFSYLVGGSIAYFFHKKHIIVVATLVSIACVILGHLLGYYPFWVFVVIMSIIGLMYGLWTIVKSVLLTIEIQNSSFSETTVTGMVNVALLVGIILWSYLWFEVYSLWGANGFWVIVGLLTASLITTLFLNYEKTFVRHNVKETLRIAIPSIMDVIKKYIRLLVPIGVLRAISTAMGQKMLEIGVDVFNKTLKSSIRIIVVSILGAIIGSILSTLFKRRKRFYTILFTIILWLSTIYFPNIINKYDYYITLSICSFLMGIVFGIAVNLLEARFFYHIWEDHEKEYGSAAYGIVSNLLLFAIMIMSDILTHHGWMVLPFIFFGIILFLMPFFIKRFK